MIQLIKKPVTAPDRAWTASSAGMVNTNTAIINPTANAISAAT
jgi:hypothetical protein